MRTHQSIILLIAALLISGSLIFHGYAQIKGPSIVVYLDKDAKQPAALPISKTTAITGDRAALWWAVFCKAEEKQFPANAAETANTAVRNVYGNPK